MRVKFEHYTAEIGDCMECGRKDVLVISDQPDPFIDELPSSVCVCCIKALIAAYKSANKSLGAGHEPLPKD